MGFWIGQVMKTDFPLGFCTPIFSKEYFIRIYISVQFLTLPYSVGQLSSSNDLYLEASSPTITSFNCTSSAKDSSDLSIGRPTSEAKLAFGKLSPAYPIFMQPVPGSHIIAGYVFIDQFIFQKRLQIIIQDMYEGQHQQQQHEYQEVHEPVHQHVDPVTKLNAALSLTKTMPPSKLKKNLIGLVRLAPQIEDHLFQKIELPLQIDDQNPNFPYLKTQFNRDGSSYRNPYTNYYSPENPDGYRPTGIYRTMEESGGYLFAQYVRQYYGGNTVGSFYVLESDQGNGNFSCGFFAKKISNQGEGFSGNWDSFNIVDVTFDGTSYHYKLNSTVLIEMDINKSGINLTGFLKKNKQNTKTYKGLAQNDLIGHHLQTIGELIEDLQTVMRQYLEAIYVARTKQVIFTTRYENTIAAQKQRISLAGDLRKLRFGE